MKRWFFAIATLGAVSAALVQGTSQGQFGGPKSTDLGPGSQGATLKQPGAEPVAVNPYGAQPAFVQPTLTPKPVERIAQPPSNQVDINKDIEIAPTVGPWVIFLTAYKGPTAPEKARKCVAELRNTHKLNAYVFNYGAEEKQKEYERVQALKKQQLEAIKNSPLATGVVMPIRIPTMRIDEQTGVLIAGNFKTREEAMETVKKLRKLVPDPKKMDLEVIEVQIEHFEKFKLEKVETVKDAKVPGRFYDNPFLKAFPTRNPAAKGEPSPEDKAADLKLMQHINKDEPFSLLTCKKPVTLVIKQFNSQVKDYRSKAEAEDFLDRFKKQKGEWSDMAANNAHNLAEAFRKGGLPDTYVLHCRYCSYVTVGAYEKLDDPRLIAMQNHLETQFKADAYRRLEMYPRPVPMAVPR